MAAPVRALRFRSALVILGLVAGALAGNGVSGAAGPSDEPVIYDDFEPGRLRGIYRRPCSVELRNGRGVKSGNAECLYNHVVGDAHLSFLFKPVAGRQGSYGAIVFADTAIDPFMDHYVQVWADPSENVVRIVPWNRGRTAPFESPIPAESEFAAGRWNEMAILLERGTITVALNGVEVTRWEGPAPALRGYVGWIVESVTVDPPSERARMRIDDFTVISHGYNFPGAPPLLYQTSIT